MSRFNTDLSGSHSQSEMPFCCCVSENERQCKFPLACILRQSWQAEVITEWLTHQHGEDLSPPGREIAKSQFTHIQLPVWA